MNNFITIFRQYESFKESGFLDYRICWFPLGKDGNGLWELIQFFDDEIEKIDPNKCEIVLL